MQSYKSLILSLVYENNFFFIIFSGLNFREKAHLIKQRYYERALRKWKNTTNFAEGYSIPALKDVKAPRYHLVFHFILQIH